MARFKVTCTTLGTIAAALSLAACGGDDVTCGAGTTKKGSQCVAATTGGTAGEAGSGGQGGDSGSAGAGASGAAGTGGDAGSGTIVDAPPDFTGAEAAAPASETSLQISWPAATDDNTPAEDLTYNIYLATASGQQNFGEPTYTAPAGARFFVATHLTTATDYFAVVRAVDAAGNTDTNTAEVTDKPADDTTPPTFGGATAAANSSATSVQVSWDAATDDPNAAESISYLVFWSDLATGAKTGNLGVASAPGATSAIVPDLPAANTTFFFHVRAVDASGNVEDNDVEIAGVTGDDDDDPVFGGCTGVTKVTASGATVSWKPARDNVTPPDLMKVNVYAELGEYKIGDPLGFSVGTFTGASEGVITDLLPDADYSFVCRAEDGAGNLEENSIVRFAHTLADGLPPVFTGLLGAAPESTTIALTWNAGTDDQTAPKDIVYAAYVASAAGGQDFTTPTQVSLAGTTGMTLSMLSSNTRYYVVVRARDLAGNEDTNTTEIAAKTLVSFSLDVQPIFTQHCAVAGCHVPGNPPQGQILSEGYAYTNIVDVDSGQPDPRKRVDSTSSDPMQSYLYLKISGLAAFGTIMPPPTQMDPLNQAEIDTIGDWIQEGAKNN